MAGCESTSDNKMVKQKDQSSDTDHDGHQVVRKHGRSSSSDQAKVQPNSCPSIMEPVEACPTPTSPSRLKHGTNERPSTKRRKSSTSSKHKSRPAYSRKYSTPPSRPLSPAGFPKHLDLDMAIPEIDLDETHRSFSCQPPQVYQDLSVDTAPQEPDIWSDPDPDTDYFSTIEGPGPKHARGKSRRQLSHNVNTIESLSAVMLRNVKNLQQIHEDVEGDFLLPPTPGAFAV